MAIPQVGEIAPDFEILTDTGAMVKLSDFRGQRVVLYFYPKADTPGCTAQACAFRDNYDQFQKQDVVVLGASPDTPEDQAAFKAKYALPFTLLADADHSLAEVYGIWGTHKFLNRSGVEVEYVGLRRSTFIIDGEGKFADVLIGVDPANNANEVLAALS